MTTMGLPPRAELAAISDWTSLKMTYGGLSFDSPPCERVEAEGVEKHKLNERLPNVQEFWRLHIAPATNRPDNIYLLDDAHPVISRMAERSYETYCNISDALDELEIVNGGGATAPRYRPCLNVLRCAGDALQLFNELVRAIGKKESGQDSTANGPSSLTTILGSETVLFPDWGTGGWRDRRRTAVAHRNMLVHHGRPWLNFEGDDYVGTPYVLDAQYCIHRRYAKSFETWSRQRRMFQDPKEREDKFISLFDACHKACDLTISFINDGYGQIVNKLDSLLVQNPSKFREYRRLWGWP
jgi:hypothetical protein